MAAATSKKTTKRAFGEGNKPLEKKERLSNPETLVCDYCNKRLDAKEFYASDSEFHRAVGKIPYCKECIGELYNLYYDKYHKIGLDFPDRKAMDKLCMTFDLYYSDKIFDTALSFIEEHVDTTIAAAYFRMVKMYQYRDKDYDTTVREKYNAAQDVAISSTKKFNNVPDAVEIKDEQKKQIKEAEDLFGFGFQQRDYIFLYDQYTDWTSRHECNSKAQEEVFKEICLTQLELQKKHRVGEDTKDLTATFQKLLDTANLQPKQNTSETISDAQTFGKLIDKWETEKPCPEIDKELEDVDRIGLYIDVFFKGHLAKMMGFKNSKSDLYDKFMEDYTVHEPEYVDDEDEEALFDSIFGSASLEDDEEEE